MGGTAPWGGFVSFPFCFPFGSPSTPLEGISDKGGSAEGGRRQEDMLKRTPDTPDESPPGKADVSCPPIVKWGLRALHFDWSSLGGDGVNGSDGGGLSHVTPRVGRGWGGMEARAAGARPTAPTSPWREGGLWGARRLIGTLVVRLRGSWCWAQGLSVLFRRWRGVDGGGRRHATCREACGAVGRIGDADWTSSVFLVVM